MSDDKKITIDSNSVDLFTRVLLGYKNNGVPRSVWDIVKDGVDMVEGKHGKKGKKKRKKNGKKKSSKSLAYYYKHAFDLKDW